MPDDKTITLKGSPPTLTVTVQPRADGRPYIGLHQCGQVITFRIDDYPSIDTEISKAIMRSADTAQPDERPVFDPDKPPSPSNP